MNILAFLESITLLSIVKVLVIVLLIVYDIFAYLMMKQIGAMTRAVTMRDDYVIRMLGIAHFIFAILVMVIAVTLL